MQWGLVTIPVLGGLVVWCMSYFRPLIWILVTSSPLPGICSLEFGTRRLFQERGLWRGGGGVDENRFGTVRQQSNMCRIMHLLNLHAYSHIFECLLGCLIRFSHNLEVTVHNFQESGLKCWESASPPNNNNIGVSLSQAITLFLIVSSPEWRKAWGMNRKGWRLITLFSLLYYNQFERIPGWCL